MLDIPVTPRTYCTGDQKLANHGDSLVAMIQGFLKKHQITLMGEFPWEEDKDAQVRRG